MIHGTHPYYKVWQGLKQRCLNPNSRQYKNYGGRGIIVCEEWLHDFEQFVKDMGERPQGYSIDRIDNDKGYSPDNCRWANYTQQNRNQRHRPNQTGYQNVHKNRNHWKAAIYLNGKSIHLGNFRTPEEAHQVAMKAKAEHYGEIYV